MQYQVPQFINLEPKIAFFLTIHQILYLAVAGAFVFFLRFMPIPGFVKLFLTVFMLMACVALAFVRVNGRALSVYIFSMLGFLMGGKVFVWRQRGVKIQSGKKTEMKFIKPHPEPLTRGESEVDKLNRQISLGA